MNHPIEKHKIRFYLSHMPLWGIILCFPFAYTLIALIIPSIILLTNCTIIGKKEIYELLSCFMNTALGQNTTYPMWVKPIEVYTMQIWLMFCGMIVPAIFFGAFVYKLVFISEPFVFRKKVSLYQNIQNANNYIFSIRLYNALLVPIADVRFRIFARIPYTARDNTKSVKNIELSLIDDSKKKWPISFPFVPYTLRLPASCSCKPSPKYGLQDFSCTPSAIIGKDQVPMQFALKPTHKKNNNSHQGIELVVFVEGRAPWFGMQANQFKIYNISEGDISYGYPTPIDMINYKNSPSAWDGWDNFEKNSEKKRPWKWVFGYGSLVDLMSLKKTLEKNQICSQEYIYCSLKGFVREWNVAMDNTKKIQGYKYYKNSKGEIPPVGVTFLNLSKTKSDHAVNGILFRVNKKELERLTERERNYEPIEIDADLDIKPPAKKIIVFIASRDGRDRFDHFKTNGKAVISEEYRDQVEDAFKNTGLHNNYYNGYVNSTISPEIPVIKLEKIYLD